MKKVVIIGLAAACAMQSTTVPAQFGGLGKIAKGVMGGGGGTATSTDAEGFLTNATRSTKNVMISAALLAQAVTDRAGLSGRKAQIEALQKVQDIKELSAHKEMLQSDLATLNQRSDLAGDLSAAYKAGDDQQKKLIGTAVGNLAIGIARNMQLAGQSSGLVSGIGSNPALASRAGQFKTAAGLVGLQAKGLGGIATTMPKLLAAARVRGPKEAAASEPQPVTF